MQHPMLEYLLFLYRYAAMTDGFRIEKLAKNLVSKGPLKVENSPKRVRILNKGHFIVDTTHAKYVWEHPYYPQ